MIVLGRTYLLTYTDGRGQAQTERGHLVSLDQDGFVVLEVNGKHLLIPKARVDALVEVDLVSQTLVRGNAARIGFQVPGFRRDALLRGDDDIAGTLRHAETISRHVAGDRARRGWAHRAIATEEKR